MRPQVLVTYDPNGGYGHPDHIQAHRVAMRAAELAAEPASAPSSASRTHVAKGLLELRAALGGRGGLRPAADRRRGGGVFPFRLHGIRASPCPTTCRGWWTTRPRSMSPIDGTAYAEGEGGGDGAHATQIAVNETCGTSSRSPTASPSR